MSDPWVTKVQTWINTTYTSVPAVGKVTVNGQTGWQTMYALTRALQHELGITSLSDTFGDGTYAALTTYGNISATVPAGTATSAAVQKYRKLMKLVQAAMYCKGYNGGNGEIDGIWSATTTAGITKLRTDMGIDTTSKTVSPKIFKALLNMDAYVLTTGGSTTVRTIQRELNTRYAGSRKEFYIIPTDGFYSRDVQRGMMYAIQYELGMSDSVANGNFGPGTSSGLTNSANFGVGSNGSFLIKLYQAALIFNGFAALYEGKFTDTTAAITREFQTFCKLAVTGRSDFRTWASLLVSTGDATRPGTACDTIREITPARAQTLKKNGYTTVGRYLTNTPDVVDPLDKKIKSGELQSIFAAGLRVFPIFQEGGTGLTYFGRAAGEVAGARAHNAATGHGFRAGTTIYFAVDFDVLEHEVISHIVPYFEGIKAAIDLRGKKYSIGIYGSRNTCIIVSKRGLAKYSFVSGMSTGFSGNLGYPLPPNWAFDQILEYDLLDTNGDGTADVQVGGVGWVNIDKNIQSGLDLGQSSILTSSSDGRADVPLPEHLKAQFTAELARSIRAVMPALQQPLTVRRPEQVAPIVLQHDSLITALAWSLKMRKSLIQAVLGWELACLNAGDEVRDLEVITNHNRRIATGTVLPLVKYDSSTGLSQIFADSAINATNWAKIQGLSSEPQRSTANLDHIYEVWGKLRTDANYNIRAASLRLRFGAWETNINGSLLKISSDQARVVLSSYNDAGYGAKVIVIYDALEAINKTARGE